MSIDLDKITVLDNNDIVYNGNETKKLRFKLEGMFIPFGVESYHNKFIMNLSFKNKEKDNKMHNYYVVLKCIDEYFDKLEGFGSSYSPFIKENGSFDPLLRCHLKSKKDNIFSKFYDNGELTESDKLKKRVCKASITIGSIWEKGDKYGVIIYIDKIELV